MARADKWLLPDGVDELLPPDAWRVEGLRRLILDRFAAWGYELVVPPLIEFLDSMLSAGAEDLELQTFKLTDQVSGRMMGVRADITPQIARIDAHRLPTDLPQRLCYVGPVLHTMPDKFAGSRNPLQVGAELYGHEGIESDAEIVSLMVDVLHASGVQQLTVELGHMGVFQALVDHAGVERDIADKILAALLRKAEDDLAECVTDHAIDDASAGYFRALMALNGGADVLSDASDAFAGAPAAVTQAVEHLRSLVEALQIRVPELELHIDLAELRGYRYHTGVTFAAYRPGEGREIAWGGRYDNIGYQFGRDRAATGFSTDLKNLVAAQQPRPESRQRIFAPAGNAVDLVAFIATLRDAGSIVIQALPGQPGDAAQLGCTHQIVAKSGNWHVEAL